MFKIKICGITTPDDALLAAAAGADAIGLNFYEKSPRYVSPELASEIASGVASAGDVRELLRIVGVFVNSRFDDATEAMLMLAVTDFQYHGDEPPSTIAAQSKMARILASNLPRELSVEWLIERMQSDSPPEAVRDPAALVIRAFRPTSNSLSYITSYLQECKVAGGLPHAVLLDAHAPGSFGGTGRTLDWNMIRDQRDKLLGLPLILAGGLTPENVAEAIRTARPDAVDVASGVESSPGKKDASKVRDFIAAALEAFAEINPPKSSPGGTAPQ